MAVALVGPSPVAGPVGAGLEAMEIEVDRVPLDEVRRESITIVADASGGDRFPRANDHLEGPWIGVELGGMGGWAIEGVTGMIAVLDSAGPCYRCLSTRLEAAGTIDDPDGGSVDRAPARFAGALVGWHLLAGSQEPLESTVGAIIELDGSTRTLLPVPGCRCDSSTRPRGVEPAIDDGRTALEETIDRAERAFDDRLGIILEVGERSSFPAPYYLAHLADTTPFSDAAAATLAAGVDREWDAAFMRAMGEALERYCAGVYRLDGLPASPRGTTVPLDRFALATETDAPLGRWWAAVGLPGFDEVSVPAELVTFPTPDGSDVGGITTGLGFGSSTAAAILSGLLEVIERDAAMIGWYSTFEPLKLTVDTPGYRTLERRAASEGLGVTSLLVTQDIDVPVVTAVVHRRNADGDPAVDLPGIGADDWPAFAVGSSAGLDPGHVAERALAEAVQNWVELGGMGREQAESEGAYGRFANFPRAARTMLTVDRKVAATSVEPDPIPAGRAAVEYVVARVREAGLSTYVARTTTRDVADLGFEAVRVLVPAAQPLVRGEGPISERLPSVPRSLGFRPRLDRGPHPYP